MKMFGRVLVLRGIAATDVSAGQTQAEVDPSVAHLQTFLTTVSMGLHIVDLVEVCAFGHI
jgi:hypothetical protein